MFPASSLYIDRQSGLRKRHYLHESALQKAVRDAALKAGLSKPASPHTFRHPFSALTRHSVRDTESSQALWIPAPAPDSDPGSAGMTNSR